MPFKGKKATNANRKPYKVGRSLIINDYKKYERLLDDSLSYLSRVLHHVHVCLLPEYFNKKKEALDLLLTEKLGMYSTELQGFQMAYNPNKVSFKEKMGVAIGVQPVVHFDISTDFIIFQPKPGATLEAVVNKKLEHMVGCLVHERFYVAMHDCDNKQNTTWLNEIDYGDTILVKITKIEENQSGYVSLIGSFVKKLQSVKHTFDNKGDDSGVCLEEENSSPLHNTKINFEELQTTTTIEHIETTIQPIKKKKKSKKRKHEKENLDTVEVPYKVIKIKQEPIDEEIEMRLKQTEATIPVNIPAIGDENTKHKKLKKSKKHKNTIKVKEEPVDHNCKSFPQSTDLPELGVSQQQQQNYQVNESNVETPSKEHKSKKKKKKEKKIKIKKEKDLVQSWLG